MDWDIHILGFMGVKDSRILTQYLAERMAKRYWVKCASIVAIQVIYRFMPRLLSVMLQRDRKRFLALHKGIESDMRHRQHLYRCAQDRQQRARDFTQQLAQRVQETETIQEFQAHINSIMGDTDGGDLGCLGLKPWPEDARSLLR